LSSTSDSNEQVNNTFLSTALPSLIRARGRLVLATTEGGTKPKGVPYGGVATVSGGSFANYGTVTTTVQDLDNKAANVTQFFGALTNERGGTVVDRSGLLQVNSVTNKGTLTVAPKASLDLIAQGPGSGLPSGVVTNSGTIENGGTISAQGGTWSQLGGEVAGNPVILQDSTTLVDRAGPGKFVADSGNANLVGTVPKGQTVTVIGTGLGLAGTTVVNNGALVLEAQGPKTTGASAAIGNGTIRNNGNVIAEVVGHSTWAVNWQIGLTNNQAGRVTLTGGTLNEAGNGSGTNAGTVTVGPGAVWLLQEGSAFTNQRGGKIVPEISGPTSVGQFAVQSPCCNGAGVVNAGGALVPALVGGYTPPANKDFPVVDLEGGKFAGTFGTVGAPFSADYTHETTTPAFVGVVYKSTKPKSNKT
jgi:hypothetical protein